jgi:hypothetical protein
MQERERRLRRRFGPPVDEPQPSPAPAAGRGPRRRAGLAGLAVALAVLVALAGTGAFLAATPHDHVAPGCSWWGARTVSAVAPGQRGCVRAYVRVGGELADGRDPSSFALSYSTADPDHTSHRCCPYQPGDAVVARYHAVFDDGRTIVVVDACR